MPSFIPPRRSFVHEGHFETLTVPGGKEGRIGEAMRSVNDQGLVMIEWDIALDLEDINVFKGAIIQHPDSIQVGMYKLYHDRPGRTESSWAHRVTDTYSQLLPDGVTLLVPDFKRIVREGDEWADWFGFGIIYVPKQVLDAAEEEGAYSKWVFPDADTNFSKWCESKGWRARLVWGCTPKHLHFQLESTIERPPVYEEWS